MPSPEAKDRWLRRALVVLAIPSAFATVTIFLFLVSESLPVLREVSWLRFVTDDGWYPTQGQYNFTPIILGSLAVTVGAVVLATPLGFGCVLFLNFYGPTRLRFLLRRIIELLAAIPSIVFGFWGLVVLVPMIARWQPPGASLLAAILVLAIMILPTFVLAADAAVRTVPPSYLESAAALGLSRAAVVRRIVLPLAGPGMAAGLVLQTGRALGETMAVLLVCGNIVQVPSSLFDPVRTLTANIALEMAYAMGTHRSSLFLSGLVLLVITAGLVLAASRLREVRA